MADNNSKDVINNPQSKEHLPVAGEFDARNIPDNNPLTTNNEDDISIK